MGFLLEVLVSFLLKFQLNWYSSSKSSCGSSTYSFLDSSRYYNCDTNSRDSCRAFFWLFCWDPFRQSSWNSRRYLFGCSFWAFSKISSRNFSKDFFQSFLQKFFMEFIMEYLHKLLLAFIQRFLKQLLLPFT